MKFTELELTNWAVYRDTTTVQFDSTPEKPIILINGNNDKGKTSLFYAIRYALYGGIKGLKSHPKENYRKLSEWANFYSAKDGDGELCVELSIEMEDNTLIRIQRKRKFFQTPTGAEITLSRSDELTIFEDGEIKNVGKDEREVNRWIENHILPNDASQFFLFDGEVIQRYTQTPGPTVQKAIQQVLGLAEIKKSEKVLSTLLENIQNEKTKKARLTTKDAKIKNDLDVVTLDIKNFEILISGTKAQKVAAEKLIEENNKVIKEWKELREKKDRQSELQSRITDNKLTLEEYKTELKGNRDYAGLLLANPLLKIILTTQETPSSLEQWESQTSAYIIDNEIKDCVCETKIDEGILDKLKGKVLQLKENPFSNLKRLGENISASYRPDAIDVQLNNVINKISDTEDKIKLDQEEKDLISEEIKNNPDIGQDLKDREEANKKASKDIGVMEDKIDKDEKEQNRLKGRLKNLTTQIIQSSASNDLQELIEQEKYVEKTIRVFVKSFNDYFILEKPKLEKTITEVFRKLTNAPEKYEGISLTPEFEIEIIRKDGEKLPAHRYSPSAGASQIAITAVIAGFNKHSTRKAPVLIDTPAGRLDPIHTENLLEYYPTMSEQVIILPQSGEITPKDEEIISDFVSTRYTIVPKASDPNQSKIVRDKA
jgi:DNA sulfur modification protein DndD